MRKIAFQLIFWIWVLVSTFFLFHIISTWNIHRLIQSWAAKVRSLIEISPWESLRIEMGSNVEIDQLQCFVLILLSQQKTNRPRNVGPGLSRSKEDTLASLLALSRALGIKGTRDSGCHPGRQHGPAVHRVEARVTQGACQWIFRVQIFFFGERNVEWYKYAHNRHGLIMSHSGGSLKSQLLVYRIKENIRWALVVHFFSWSSARLACWSNLAPPIFSH